MKTNAKMNQKDAGLWLLMFGALFTPGTAPAQNGQPPVLTNVVAGQRSGTKLVDIHYDLIYGGTTPITLSALVSSNSGAGWNIPAYIFTGDYGPGVTPGTGKSIVWNAGADWDGHYTTNCRVRLQAQPTTAWPNREPLFLPWVSVASSVDGSKLVAAAQGPTPGGIYTSIDSGITWLQTSAPSTNWTSVASSADGTKLFAATAASGSANGGIYTSTNSGAHWTLAMLPSGTFQTWLSLAASADGTKLVAASAYTGTGSGSGGIYTYANGNFVETFGTTNRFSVASSADGSKLVAVAQGGGIYTSTDSGVTWSLDFLGAGQSWLSVASSADGTKLVAAEAFTGTGPGYGGIYTSADSGTNWVQVFGTTNRFSVASSADGSKLVAVAQGGGIYTSTDSGVTWPQTTAPALQWTSVATSADGTRIVALASTGSGAGTGIYTAAFW